MFCRYCGRQIHDDSIFCSFCGKQLAGEEEKKDAALITPFMSDPEFVWDLHEFPEHKKTEAVNFSWAQDKAETRTEAETVTEPEAETEAETGQETEATREDNSERGAMPEFGLAAALDAEQDSKIDKFYTFNKKNEEFQKLLDKEYERVKGKEPSDKEYSESPESAGSSEPAPTAWYKPPLWGGPAMEAEPELKPAPKPQPVPAPKPQHEQAPALELVPEQTEKLPEPTEKLPEDRLIYDNDTLSKRFDTREFNKDLIEVALEKAGIILEKDYEISRADDTYFSDFKPRFIEESEESESESVGVGVGEAENAQAAEDVITDILPLVDPKKQEAFKALEELWDSESRSAEEKKSVEKKEKREDSEHTEKLEYSEKIEQVEAYPLAPVQTQIAQHGGKEGLAFVITDKEGDLADKEGTTADGIAEGAKEKVGVKKVLLVILVIVLLLEMAALGLKYLAPNSIGAAFVNRYLKFAVTWVDDLFRKEPPPEIDDFDKDQGAQGQDTEDITDADNGEPANAAKLPEADKAALVAGQLGSNRNIVTVEAKDELKYNAANTYSDADIGSSKPIEDNVWRTFEGNDVLYDQSVVASLISFNSKWIDFVNSGDESILEVVKKGGQAEKSILDYKRGSGVKKTFKLLQIGEIRQNGNIFFIWAHEMIQDTANGKTTENSYDWIYRMEAVDDKMLVTGYFRS